MSTLFIFGNGFDIAHGIPTKYSDFRTFIIDSFPDALEYRDEIIYWEEILDIGVLDVAAEILLSTMDTTAGKDWCNFEEALAYLNFDKKFPVKEHKENERQKDNNITIQYLLYIDKLTKFYAGCSEVWGDFFNLWLKEIQKKIDSCEFVGKKHLKTLFAEPGAKFLTFNYTKTLQKLYGIRKVIHIHNRIGQKLVWGHDKDNVLYGQNNSNQYRAHIGSSSLDNMLAAFRKDTARPMKKYNDFFKKLDCSIDKVYSYGFSYGKVDSVYIKRIISSINPEATWYFTTYEAKDKEMLRIKKVKLRRYGFKGTFELFEG